VTLIAKKIKMVDSATGCINTPGSALWKKRKRRRERGGKVLGLVFFVWSSL
jgi:hypothetical protein